MKKIFLLLTIFSLTACGTMGVGTNKNVLVHNNSDKMIYANGEMGSLKIQPHSSITVNTNKSFQLNSSKKECNAPTVSSKLNTAALVLDIVPGFIFGVIPVLVDAVTGNLNKMPDTYIYDCI